MKILITITLLLNTLFSFSQSKKEQIEILQNQLDSIKIEMSKMKQRDDSITLKINTFEFQLEKVNQKLNTSIKSNTDSISKEINKIKMNQFLTLQKIDSILKPKTFTLTDKTVKFLWRDSSSSIVINENFCKTISEPEKAALGYVATFIGNECSWDEDYTEKRDNLKCAILTALNLDYQCSDKHLGFLRQWFKIDTAALKELEDCPTTPNTSTIQDTFDEIILTTKGSEITVFYKANGVNMREEQSWNWTETDYFQFDNDNIKLIKQEKSKVNVEHFDASEE